MSLRIISGRVVTVAPEEIIIMSHGLGFAVRPSRSTLEKASSCEGEIIVYVDPVMSQDGSLTIYAFSGEGERSLFKSLVSLQGVSRAAALGVLTLGDPESVMNLIANGNETVLKSAPNVGLKTARRIISELDFTPTVRRTPQENSILADVEKTLVSLGYSTNEIRSVIGQLDRESNLDAALKNALSLLARHR